MERVRPYLVAAGCVGAAVVSRLLLEPLLSNTQPWMTFWPAVFAAAWLGGTRAGVVTVIASVAIVTSWHIPSEAESWLGRPALVGTLVFVACGLGFTWVAQSARRARALDQRLRQEADRDHALLADLFEEAPWTMALFEGPELRIAVVNARARAIVGSSTDLVGKPLYQAVPEAAGQLPFELIRRVLDTGEPLLNSQQTAHLGGRDLTYLVSFQPVRNTDGTVRGVLAMGVDVTAQVETMRQLDAARTQAQQADRAKDEFLAILGHELRNPLAPMTTAVTLLRMRGHQSRELEVIDRQLGYMTRLVEDLLDVSRIVRGKIELRRTPTDLLATLEKAIEMVSPMCEQTGHLINVAVPRGLIVDGDPQRLTQVFSNLLSNAIKFSERGKRIDVTAQAIGERVQVRVLDQGAGISPEMLGRVFEPFVQDAQPTDRAKGGLGLGLAIVRRLVEIHGGSVSVTSQGPGRGSEFIVELPLVSTASREVTAPPTPPPTAHAQRILVVDDNPDVATLLADLLETMGHTVRVASDGPEALAVATTFAPTLALLDIGLPVMDGYELAKKLRERGVAAPLVAITGYGQERDRERAREAGFSEHLVKPVSPDKLVRVIEELTPRAAAN
jgi:PAS domain S-box-containing protein